MKKLILLVFLLGCTIQEQEKRVDMCIKLCKNNVSFYVDTILFPICICNKDCK